MKKIIEVLRGAINAIFLGLYNLVCAILIFLCAPLCLIPIPAVKKFSHYILNKIPILWGWCCNKEASLLLNIEWDIQGLENFDKTKWYLAISNHQTWVDLLVLCGALYRYLPPFRFFMKKELLWTLPIVSWAAWLVGCPFMERYSKSLLEKHPELKGKDKATTRQSCERFKILPATLFIFTEGTRFTAAKYTKQASPFQHLLKPKAGGLAFSLEVLGDCFDKMVDVTVVYPNGIPTMWDYLCGRVKKIIIRVRTLPITADLVGDYENDPTFRIHFQEWLNERWKEKDLLITNVLT